MMRRLPSLSTTAIVLAVTSSSLGGERSTMASLPVLPAPRAIAESAAKLEGLSVGRPDGVRLHLQAATTRGYCLVSRGIVSLELRAEADGPDWSEIWRFTEDDSGAQLEKTRLEVFLDKGVVRAVGRTSVVLRAVARQDGITVWGFREPNGEVTLVARGANKGHEARERTTSDKEGLGLTSSECGWGAVRLAGTTATVGTVAYLFGVVPRPGEAKRAAARRYVVNASLSKLSREPEPMLSVRIRFVEN
jgi:hypothetical protein